MFSNKNKAKRVNLARRAIRTRRSIQSRDGRLRLSVYKTLRYISAQVIDDRSSKTVASIHQKKVKTSGIKTEIAAQVGEALGAMLKEKGIDKVVFDRGSKRYHGRMKAFADGVRSKGVEF